MTDQHTEALLYQRILRAVLSTPWAMRPEQLAVVVDVLAMRAQGHRFAKEEARERVAAAQSGAPRGASSGVVAVVPLVGMIIHRAEGFSEMSGATSVQRFIARFRAALNDESTRAVVIDVDSPGGMISGVPEAASEVFSSRGSKRIVAVANAEAGSAAYWIASAADELIVSPSSEAGSIGVWTAHQDLSKYFEQAGVQHTLISAGKYKVEGHPFGALDDEARANIQERVDDSYDMFTKAVAKHRGTTPSAVRSGFGEGRMVSARQAVDLGMADRVATLDETIARLQPAPRRSAQAAVRTAHDFTF